MPGQGKLIERPYTDQERAAIQTGAEVLGMEPERAFEQLGMLTIDVYMNDTALWRNVPERVWRYTVGGFPVLKKWLSYREAAVLNRALSAVEAREFRDVARRIAALVLLEPLLDASYALIAGAAYQWPTSALAPPEAVVASAL